MSGQDSQKMAFPKGRDARIFSSSGEGWGLYDTADDCWMGDLQAPSIYIDADIAALAGSVIAHRLDLPLGRLEVRKYDGSGIQFKDEVEAVRSGKGYIARLERGTVSMLVGRPKSSPSPPSEKPLFGVVGDEK